MRHLRPVLVVAVLAVLVSGCGSLNLLPPPPTATPVSLKPAILLTPRPTPPPPTATPTAIALAEAAGTPLPAAPTATATPSLGGTPVAASEPLQGALIDDRLLSPIIGDGF